MRLSSAVRYYAEPEIFIFFGIRGLCPAPNVDSAVIRLAIRKTPPVQVVSEPLFFRVVKAAFGRPQEKRRSMRFQQGWRLPKPVSKGRFTEAEIPAGAPAEQLSLEQLPHLPMHWPRRFVHKTARCDGLRPAQAWNLKKELRANPICKSKS